MNYIWKCPLCNEQFNSRRLLGKHKKDTKHKLPPWNKGLTKYTDERVKRISENYHNKLKSGEIKPSWLGKKHSDLQRTLISNSMKKAHAEGRAHNIGESHWNSKPSYPEEFFIKVIENEFIDKNYIKEFPIGRYSADFCWVNKRLVIEIDGDQHYNRYYQLSHDIIRDEFIKSKGYIVIRVPWKRMFKEPRLWIFMLFLIIHNFIYGMLMYSIMYLNYNQDRLIFNKNLNNG